jgi:UrcA family protein
MTKTPVFAPIRTFVIGLAAAAGMLVTAPAMAAETNATRVTYADLKLASAEGQAELQRRIDRAAWSVCQYDARGRIRAPRDQVQCFRASRQDVSVRVAQIIDDHRLGG